MLVLAQSHWHLCDCLLEANVRSRKLRGGNDRHPHIPAPAHPGPVQPSPTQSSTPKPSLHTNPAQASPDLPADPSAAHHLGTTESADFLRDVGASDEPPSSLSASAPEPLPTRTRSTQRAKKLQTYRCTCDRGSLAGLPLLLTVSRAFMVLCMGEHFGSRLT